MHYKTSYTCSILDNGDLKFLGKGTNQYQVELKEYNDSLKLLSFTMKSKDKDELINFMKDNNIDFNILDKLLEKRLITNNKLVFEKVDNMDFKNNLYLDITTQYPVKSNENFKNTTFIIIGTGGIGNFMSYALATFTPKKIILIDGDTIEESNLNRQFMFKFKDIGLYKSDVLGSELRSLNPKLDIEVITHFVNEDMLQELVNNNSNVLGILSGDNDSALHVTNKIFTKYKVSFLNIGYLNDISVIGPFYIPNVSCCPYCHDSFLIEDYSDNITENRQLATNINNQHSAPSSFVNNALSSSMAMNEIIQFMSDNFKKMNSINTRFGIDTVNFSKFHINSSIDVNCKYCCIEEFNYGN